MKSITVQSLTDKFQLEVLAGASRMDRLVTRPRTHRPGLEFVGYFDFFPMERVQVLGRKEINYLLTLSVEDRVLHIGNIVKYHPPCFIVTTGQQEIPYLTHFCDQEGIPLLRTADTTNEFIAKLDSYLVKALAPELSIHGVCVNVSGIGILLRGKSGIGKSETAHTLIRRGHRFVADDIVVLKKLGPHTLLGTHNETTREFLALRSIGLINVVRQYGRKAFQDETRIVLDIELCPWRENALNNELELVPQFTEYLGVQIPHIEVQLQPGRDVAGLIEAAANNWYLKQLGYSAVEEFMKRIEDGMQP
ncbi:MULTISPECIES: HPr(Ser) kinase/phosphatase [unclassified Paenibacillus]|uniref:HPr(Ser) kinase/phosphatase n=1 Tax=unclassified Paenibacillus TaxID=185978 RepID=UPI00076D2A4A|nr:MULTISPECIES: HPr(Ser) kinase/phosphatase [unclassified Paenibacillus]KUP20734.1 serine kinase [Paenibacillus sp. DMB5]MDF9839837.1 HPr kinase/phosphorylase [Paenibacillus sp. PastF-2]MDF9846418.1 HPr kinase/phosphorylase [Paenibacillus sp. PastM-2]MDF9853233.1 HPr kinase/phosphorylase [Paenibacillus sp. PastF-1]MDH6478263.1 HPr kinase/phosphorylase [Paenibacillus sp. PastH-2]